MTSKCHQLADRTVTSIALKFGVCSTYLSRFIALLGTRRVFNVHSSAIVGKISANNDRTAPTAVKILDWQMCVLRSPACDLAMFLTLTSSRSAHLFDQLLKEYHDQLSEFLVQLGSSPDLFTFEDLLKQWKNFIIAASIFAPLGFSFILAEKEDLPEFDEMKEGSNIGDFMDMPIPTGEAFYERLIPLIEYLDV